MKPGATIRPRASITVRPISGFSVMARIVLPDIPTLRTASRLRFRIDHPSALQNNIVLLGRERWEQHEQA